MSNNNRRVGLWLIGAFGGVGSTVALGIAALQRQLTSRTSMVTATPLYEALDLDEPEQMIVGGHDVRQSNFVESIQNFQENAGVFPSTLVDPCLPELAQWADNVQPGVVLHAGETIRKLADEGRYCAVETALDAVQHIQKDILNFREKFQLDQVVVINVASTEPPFDPLPEHDSLEQTQALLESNQWTLPASTIYAWAAVDLGLPFVNFTPSLGASIGAIEKLAEIRKSVIAGKDGKTGETLMKSVLAPIFAQRNWDILSWVGHNIFGNRDGAVLDDPSNKESKIRTKDQVISQIVGYSPQTHVSIEYIKSMDDWKTAWDHIHFQGFLGVKMILQFIWQGCDSILAAPLVLDLARLSLFAQRKNESGILRHLACFFKNPMGYEDHDFFKQVAHLEEYVKSHSGDR